MVNQSVIITLNRCLEDFVQSMQHFVLAYGVPAVEVDTFAFFPSATYGMFDFCLARKAIAKAYHIRTARSYH